MAQRVGPVRVEEDEDDDGDLTIIEVPTECIGFVTGDPTRLRDQKITDMLP